jgi:deazaflavin-dependent oxidoreductase (nitroreductase family)
MAVDWNAWNNQVIEEFRANGGKVGGDFEGAPMVLLHTTGAKSGKERINPLMYLPKDDKVVVFASKGGAPDSPDWFYNLKANPDVEMELGSETVRGRATIATGDERDRLYAEQAEAWPQFKGYEEATDRTIPVVVIEKVS